MSEDKKARKVSRALSILESRYKIPTPPTICSPLETFLVAILMDAVPRARAYEALEQLKRRFVDWNEARVSTGKEIADNCKPVTISESVGRIIQRSLEKIFSDWNALSLDALKGKNAKEVREYLSKFEGVSPSAVAYTMLYGLDKGAIPITRPILRYLQRLGVVDEDCDHDRVERFLERAVPSARMAALYELFHLHAEEVCQQKEPKCRRCVTSRLCQKYREGKVPAGSGSRKVRRTIVSTVACARRIKSPKRSTEHSRRQNNN